MQLIDLLRDRIRASLTGSNEAIIETTVVDPDNPSNRLIPNASGGISSESTLSAAQEAILTAIKNAVEILDNIVAGSEAQVDVATLPQASSVPFGTVNIAVTATAQQLPDNVAKQGVIVVANELNDAANIVYIGFSNAVTNATYFKQLLPGEPTPLLPVTNSNIIWVYCVFTGGTHSYNYAVF